MSTLRRSGWLAALLLASLPATAEISVADLQVAARTLSFLQNPLSGRVRVGLVYSPERPRSQEQAMALESRLGNGLAVGNLVLLPVPVSAGSAATAGVDVFFLMDHVSSPDGEFAAVMRRRQIPCVTTDVSQAENGTCAVAVRSRPRVEIIVNREAAEASGVQFATAFRVMVTEL